MVGLDPPRAGAEQNAPAMAMLTPARARVLDAVRDASDPVTAHELSAVLGLHPTTVRFHLDRLVAEGLVSAAPCRSGARGRPATSYCALPAAGDPGGSASDVWKPMVEALAQTLENQGAGSCEKAVTAGGSWARQLLRTGPSAGGIPPWKASRDSAEEQMREILTRLGFSPHATSWGFALHSCPFLSSARKHPEVICAVHLGLSRELARQLIAPGAEGSVQLRPFAEPGACHLVFDPQGLNNSGRGHPVQTRSAVPTRHVDDVERTPR